MKIINCEQSKNIKQNGQSLLGKAFVFTSSMSIIGLTIWQFIKNNRALLPSPEQEAGNNLAGEYLGTSYDIFLILLISAIVFLACKIIKAKQEEIKREDPRDRKYLGTRFISFIRMNPVVSIILAAYTIVLVQEATWFHGELVGWIKDVFKGNLLNNFSIRYDFVYETLRREDYRLFPLSHQDLHVFTWFTPYVKVMMLISAFQLYTIVIAAKRFSENLNQRASTSSLLLISTIILLFSASVGNAFFQLDYPGRMLTFLLSIYSLTYYHYLKSKSRSSLYLTFTLALLGVYWKDTGFILYIIPPLAVLAFNYLGIWHINSDQESVINPIKNWSRFYSRYELELWLFWLFSVFCLSYIFLSLIPSTYLSSESYGSQSAVKDFSPNLRFWVLASCSGFRIVMIALRRFKANLLDALNISALLYALALYILVGFKDYSYQYAPIEFTTTLNLLALWLWSANVLNKNITTNVRLVSSVGVAGSLLLVGYEHLDFRTSFYGHASRVHELHNSWEETYNTIDKLSRKLKEDGNEVNIIYTSQSWLSERRHLDRLRYDRLVEWNPGYNKFIVMDGIGRKSTYLPRNGDIYINIDRTDQILPTPPGYKYKKIYQFNHKHTDLINGQIYEIRRIK